MWWEKGDFEYHGLCLVVSDRANQLTTLLFRQRIVDRCFFAVDGGNKFLER